MSTINSSTVWGDKSGLLLVVKKVFSNPQNHVIVWVSVIGAATVLFSESFSVLFGTLGFPLFALSSCSGCAGDCCGNGSSGGNPWTPPTSTPFLAVMRGGKYHIENDVMYAKRLNYFAYREIGQRVYEEKIITPELYKILETPDEKDGVHLQLREIEPEESFIDHITLQKVVYPATTELIVDATFKKMWVLDKSALNKNEGVKNISISTDAERVIPQTLSSGLEGKMATEEVRQQKVHVMDANESVEIRATVVNKSRQLFLLLGSNYRDWALPYEATPLTSKQLVGSGMFGTSSSLFQRIAKVAVFTMVVVPVWAISSLFTNVFSSQKKGTDTGLDLARTFGIPKTSADVPAKCFNVEYWNGATFVPVTFVQPRYYQMSLEAVALPEGAVNEVGEVRVRVTATQRHNLSHLSLVAPEEQYEYRDEVLTLTSAVHERTGSNQTALLSSEYSGEYLHAIPADVVNVAFSAPTLVAAASEQSSYIVSVRGFYTRLSSEGQELAGDWESRLSSDSKEWLEKMVALKAESGAV